MELKKKIALIAAGSLLSIGGLYAVSTSANAAPSSAPAVASSTSGIQAPTGTADVDNLQEGSQNATDGATEGVNDGTSDGADTGADINASEPGHQDAPGTDDPTEGVDLPEAASK